MKWPTFDSDSDPLAELLTRFGIPQESQPSAEKLAFSLFITLCTSFVLFLIFGRRQRKKQRVLREKLEEALEAIEKLEEELEEQELEEAEKLKQQNRQIRVWMDGAFDMFHYGREFFFDAFLLEEKYREPFSFLTNS
jgi:ethanolamine-phosphate cytidylyltransferase